MSEENLIDVEVNLGKELADELFGMTKLRLINRLVVLILKERVQMETIEALESDLKKADKVISGAKFNGYQATEIIKTIMRTW